MDNNVSKNTFYYIFLKSGSSKENLAIKKLLNQRILELIELYQRNSDLNTQINLIKHLNTHKISLSGLKKNSSLNIVYRCAIAFPLANYWHLSPLTVAQKLREFLLTTDVISTTQPILDFNVQVSSPGWIDCYMSDNALAVWLGELVDWVSQEQRGSGQNPRPKGYTFGYRRQTQTPVPSSRGTRPTDWLGNADQERGVRGAEGQRGRGGEDFFAVQYAHARCCSLLRLGHQEKLIKIKQSHSSWAIIEPLNLSWVNASNIFLLGHPTEKHLLIQLLMVVEELITDSQKVNWTKLAHNLSEAFLKFWADCRIYGEVKQKTPDLAKARLGLVALVQYFLYQILQDKLSILPMTEL